MHIAFLLTQSLDSPSGLGRYGPVARELVRRGYQVTVMALHPDYAHLTERRFEEEGVAVWYVSQMHVQKRASHKRYFGPGRLLWVTALAAWSLTTAALRTPADLYHVGKPHPMNGIAGVIASRLRRKPLLLDCDDYEAGSNRFSGGWQQRIVAAFEDNLPRWAEKITVNTRFMQSRLERLGVPPSRIVYVPNGVERSRFTNTSQTKATAAALGEELGLTGQPVVLYVGSLSLASHAVDLLLGAFAQLLRKVPEAVLLVVGGGEDLDRLERQAMEAGIIENVRFAGRVAPEAVAAYYRLADVSVDPVRDDPASRARSPLKLFESWAMGSPFVTADVGDRGELLGQPPAGGLAADDSSEALANQLWSVLQDPAVAQTFSELGKVRVEEAYWDRRVAAFTSAYRHGKPIQRSTNL
jgi:glycosyltransferase involved in cell wall biosynthesis